MDINEVLQGLSNLGGEMPRVANKRKIKKIDPSKPQKNVKEAFPKRKGKRRGPMNIDLSKLGEDVEKMKELVERAKQVKAKSKMPKKNKPSTGHQSPHPFQGQLVGESVEDFIVEYKDLLEKVKRGEELTEQEQLMLAEGNGRIRKAALALLLGIGLHQMADLTSAKHTPLGQDLKIAAQQGDELAQFYYKNLDIYVDDSDQRTLVNLKVLYDKDDPRYNPDSADHKRVLSKQANMPIEEAKFSGTKEKVVSAVVRQLEQKALDEDGFSLLRRLANLLGKKVYKRDNGSLMFEDKIPFEQCPICRGEIVHIDEAKGKKDACYHKVKSRYKVWPSAYASGALVQCRKKGAKNWGNSKKK